MSEGSLVCPQCATSHPAGERFCPACGLPLTFAPGAQREERVSDARERARKVKPQYSDGELVCVAGARHQAEAELIQGILLEEGVPSMLRRTRGFDVPDMLAAGPRDVMVPASGATAAREALGQAELLGGPAQAVVQRPGRLLALLTAGVAVAAVAVWVIAEVLG